MFKINLSGRKTMVKQKQKTEQEMEELQTRGLWKRHPHLKGKMISFLVLVGIIAIISAFRWFNHLSETLMPYSGTTETLIENSSLEKLAGSGWVNIAENENLMLELNFDDGNIKVTNKKSGYIWRSSPTDEDMSQEQSNDIWKGNLKSPVVFGYIQDYKSADAKYGNISMQNAKMSVFGLEDGVRVYFEFSSGVTVGYDLRLKEDHLEASLPPNLISDPGEVYMTNGEGKQQLDKKNTYIMTDISLFPFLGATLGTAGEKGYLFVPDGNGGLMNFDSTKLINSQFIGHVYGTDLALFNNYDNTLQAELSRPSIKYPVYGIVRNGNSMMAIIDKGETQADIVASKAGVQTGFHTVNSRFIYRPKYKIVTDTVSGNGYFTYSNFTVNESRQINYYFDCDANASYVGMAKTYRNYLKEKYNLTKIDVNIDKPALQLGIVGGDVESSMLGKKFVAATTFDQAKEILQDLKDSGVENADITLYGWAKYGNSVEFPIRFPIPKQLGGEDGLRSLVDYSKQLDYKLYLSDDNLSLYTKKGIRLRKDTVYNVQDNSLFEGQYANISFALKHFEQSASKYSELGIDGIEEYGIGNHLFSDFNKYSLMSREEEKNAQIALIEKMRSQFKDIRIASSFAYILADHVKLTDIPGPSYYTVIDENVPFYTTALHGLVEYDCGNYNNEFYEPSQQLLNAVEMGGNVSYTVTKEPNEVLKKCWSSYYYSTRYEDWKNTILKEYGRIQDYLLETQGKYIENYEKISEDLVKVTYEGGVVVYVNYSNQPAEDNGHRIPAIDFLIVKEASSK